MSIRYIMSMLEYHHNDLQGEFPAFDKPVVLPAGSVKGMAPVYLRRYIDQDPTSYYMFMKADPTKGDASRDAAKAYFKKLFYEKFNMPSSYDVRVGGQYDTDMAVSKEILPAADDSSFRTYYQEQMDALRQSMGLEQNPEEANAEREAARQAKIAKLGFDPDDGKTIDMDLNGDTATMRTNGTAATREVGTAQTRAVAIPKPIFYAVDFHASGTNYELGDNSQRNRVGGRNSARRLRESAKNKKISEDDILKNRHHNGHIPMNEAQWTQEDSNYIADMFSSYGGISSRSSGRPDYRSTLIDKFIQQHQYELKDLISRYDQAGNFGDFSRARDLSNDDLDENDDVLNESFVAHANYLGKE